MHCFVFFLTIEVTNKAVELCWYGRSRRVCWNAGGSRFAMWAQVRWRRACCFLASQKNYPETWDVFALGGLAEIGVWQVGVVAQCICAGTCSAVQSHVEVEKLLPARPCRELAFVSVHRDLHLFTLLSNARQAELPVSWWLLSPWEIAAEILLYSCHMRNAGNFLRTPSLNILMAIKAWKEMIASCSKGWIGLEKEKPLFSLLDDLGLTCRGRCW